MNKPRAPRDKEFLITTAQAIAAKLRQRSEGTPLHLRIPSGAKATHTNGWSVVIGNLGKNQSRLEVWFDRFSRYSQRRLWACFASSKSRLPIVAITKRVSRKLWPRRTLTLKDTRVGKFFALAKRLDRAAFNVPILEQYSDGQTFYGIYDPTPGSSAKVSITFCARAVDFFEDVVRTLPRAKEQKLERDIYPQIENRKLVTSHLLRERSGYLATARKILDDYECQVCRLRFADVYGELGEGFAEAHHRIPLRQLKGKVETRLEDLATACANCHRMLHRMDGVRNDVEKLRAIVRKHKRMYPKGGRQEK